LQSGGKQRPAQSGRWFCLSVFYFQIYNLEAEMLLRVRAGVENSPKEVFLLELQEVRKLFIAPDFRIVL